MSNISGIPKAFLSYASEDRELFAQPMAEALMERGVQVWYDAWEIQPGDSLTSKLFEDGLAKADALVVLLSPKSVNKKWVREELNVGNIRRIQENMKIIPIVIGECAIPTALIDVVRITMSHLDTADSVAARVADALYSRDTRPPLGKPPSYVTNTVRSPTTALDRVDVNVLCAIGKSADEDENDSVMIDRVSESIAVLGISSGQMFESIDILEELYCVNVVRGQDGSAVEVKLRPKGRTWYEQAVSKDSSRMRKAVAAAIVAGEQFSESIAQSIGASAYEVRTIMTDFCNNGLLELSFDQGGGAYVKRFSPRLRRLN